MQELHTKVTIQSSLEQELVMSKPKQKEQQYDWPLI